MNSAPDSDQKIAAIAPGAAMQNQAEAVPAPPPVFSKKDWAEGVLSSSTWEFSEEQHGPLLLLQCIWQSQIDWDEERTLPPQNPKTVEPLDHLERFKRRQHLGVGLSPRHGAWNVQKLIGQLSDELLEKFILTLGIHLSNQPSRLLTKGYREQLMHFFRGEELNKIVFFWPTERSVKPESSFSEENYLRELRDLGILGAEKLFIHYPIWRLREEPKWFTLSRPIEPLVKKICDASWLNSQYFYNFLRWFA